MPRAPRRKRDSAAHIYATCRPHGTCPQDVVNKIEHTTPADKILQWGSSAVYLGGTGIQTGRGSGRAPVPARVPVRAPAAPRGSAPYRPLGVPAVRPEPPIRHYGLPIVTPEGAAAVSVDVSTVTVDGQVYMLPEMGPQGSLSKDVNIGFHMVENPTEAPVLIADPVRPRTTLPPARGSLPGSGDPGIELQVLPGRENPDLIAGPSGSPMIRSVPAVSSTTRYGNPAFEIQPSTADVVGESSYPEVVHVTEQSSGGLHVSQMYIMDTEPITGGAPDIEMVDLGPPMDPEGPAIMEETPFMKTSTPVKSPAALAPTRPPGRLPRNSIWSRMFGRRVEQIPVMEDIFLSKPQDLVQFNNPAFEESVTMIFERDLQEAAAATAAPNPDFNDIVKLSAPLRTQTDTGRLRLSRLGQRGNIQTRSGMNIGPQSHFYRELSTINPEEVIELRVFGEHTGAATVVHGAAETALAEYPLQGDTAYPDGVPEDQYLDTDMVSVDLHSNLFGSFHENATVPVVTWTLPEDVPIVAAGIGGSVDVHFPAVIGRPLQPLSPAVPIPVPAVLLELYGTTYYLHPSLLKRRRKHVLL